MSNRKVLVLTIFVILGMIIGPMIYKIYKNHNDNLIKVVENEFLYYAKNCYNSGICPNEKVLLKDLYEKDYIKDKLTNPINKKYYAEDSYVDVKNLEIKLIS
ncbi:MAG: hypothetical protein K2J20_01695 [Bacilli bacterium]|nr:hypothetical protein [Bacilli bacterium]